MSNGGKIAIGGGILIGAAIWVYSYFYGIKNFAKNLIIRPKLGAIDRWKLELTGIIISVDVELGNRSPQSMTLQINALDVYYEGNQSNPLAQSIPTINTVEIKPFSTATINNLQIRIPYTALFSISSTVIETITQNLTSPLSVVGSAMSQLTDILSKTSLRIDLTLNNAINTVLFVEMETGNTSITGLGLTSTGERTILPLSDYISLIPKRSALASTNPILRRNGENEDTLVFMRTIARTYKGDTSHLANTLQGKSLRETLQNIFDFVYAHIQYTPDASYEEQIRRPLRTLYDQKGDCDCYSVLIASMLENLGIPYKFRMAAYAGRDYYQHVYVVVPSREGELVCDPVLDRCFYEKPTTKHKDF